MTPVGTEAVKDSEQVTINTRFQKMDWHQCIRVTEVRRHWRYGEFLRGSPISPGEATWACLGEDDSCWVLQMIDATVKEGKVLIPEMTKQTRWLRTDVPNWTNTGTITWSTRFGFYLRECCLLPWKGTPSLMLWSKNFLTTVYMAPVRKYLINWRTIRKTVWKNRGSKSLLLLWNSSIKLYQLWERNHRANHVQLVNKFALKTYYVIFSNPPLSSSNPSLSLIRP